MALKTLCLLLLIAGGTLLWIRESAVAVIFDVDLLSALAFLVAALAALAPALRPSPHRHAAALIAVVGAHFSGRNLVVCSR